MRTSSMITAALAALLVATVATSAQAQYRPPTGGGRAAGGGGARRFSSPYGSYAPGGISSPSRGGGRQLRRNNTPVLSPYLNIVPGFSNSFEGQYLNRTLPQQEFTRSQQQTQQALQGLQGEIDEQDVAIQTGLSGTGHATSFLNTGRYFGGGGGR